MGKSLSILKWVAGASGAGMIAAAQTNPKDAQSNISGWLEFIGFDDIQALNSAPVDTWFTVAGVILVLLAIGIATRRWWLKKATDNQLTDMAADTRERRIKLIRDCREIIASYKNSLDGNWAQYLRKQLAYHEIEPHLDSKFFESLRGGQISIIRDKSGAMIPQTHEPFSNELNRLEEKWGLNA